MKIILDFKRATLDEACKGQGTTLLIALSEIQSVREFAKKAPHAGLMTDLSIIKLKKGDEHPVEGSPDWIYERINEAQKAKGE